jgi:SAM-dependent methyltransferase
MMQSWDPVWESIFSSKPWGKYPPEHLVRFIARSFYNAADRSQVRLLEIGCGPGANLWFMAREGFTVAGIDGSASAIDIARKRIEQDGNKADLRVGDLVSLPWDADSFDAVVENVSLYCNPWLQIKRALGEVCRVLKPGGLFCSSFFTENTWGYGLGTMVEQDAFIDITEGPLCGTGFALFLRRSRAEELFGEFRNLKIDRLLRTLDDERHCVEQFVVTCNK